MPYAKFQPLLAPLGRNVEDTITRLAEQLSDFDGSFKARITVRDCGKKTTAGLNVTKKGCSVTSGSAKGNDIEVIVRGEEWWAICQGSISPIEAFGKGPFAFAGTPIWQCACWSTFPVTRESPIHAANRWTMLIETVGTVTSLKVAEELGFVYLDDGSGMPEHFILWWRGVSDRPEVSSSKRVTASMWVSMIRSAMERNVPIRIRHDDESAVVRAVYLDAA